MSWKVDSRGRFRAKCHASTASGRTCVRFATHRLHDPRFRGWVAMPCCQQHAKAQKKRDRANGIRSTIRRI